VLPASRGLNCRQLIFVVCENVCSWKIFPKWAHLRKNASFMRGAK
jgi:hypothetical protein